MARDPSRATRAGLLAIDIARIGLRVACLTIVVLAAAPLLGVAAGWRADVITSDSMAPAIRRGDVVLARPIGDRDVRVGQVVSFDDESGLGPVTHRVVGRGEQGTLHTKGDANLETDSTTIDRDAVIATPVVLVPWVGHAALWAEDRDLVPLAIVGVVLAVGLRGGPTATRSSIVGRRVVAAGTATALVFAAAAVGSTAAAFSSATANDASQLAATEVFWSGDRQFRRTLTLPAASGPTDLADFPVLVALTEDWLRTTSNGGDVTSPAADDLAFTTATTVTPLDHEIVAYDGSAGSLEAWVRVPVLSHAAATTLHLYYGDAGVGSPTEDPAGVWTNGFDAVWHMDVPPPAAQVDASGNGNDTIGVLGAMSAADRVPGPVGDAIDFDGVDDAITVANNGSGGTWHDAFSQATATAWFDATATSGDRILFETGGSTNGLALSVDVSEGAWATTRGTKVLDDGFEGGDPFSAGWTQIGGGSLTQVADPTVQGQYVARKAGANDPAGGHAALSESVSDFEAVVYSKRVDTSGGSANRYSLADDGSATQGYGLQVTDSRLRIERRSGGNWGSTTLATDTTFAWTVGQWMTLRLIKRGSTLHAEVWDGQVVTDFSDAPTPDATLDATDSAFDAFGVFAINGGYAFDTDHVQVWNISDAQPAAGTTTLHAGVKNSGVLSSLSATVGTGSPHLAHLAYDGPSGTSTLYVDGAAVATATDAPAAVATHSDGSAVGAVWESSSALGALASFEGRLDELRWQTTTRSSGWVATEWANQSDPAAFVTVGSAEPRP